VRLDGRSVLDVSVLFAMIVYGIVAMVLHGVIGWLTERVAELELKRRV
jgi:ABC-type nitrate/sulfonate/bicarbonate transport system permease component